jgi:hypothetical protein
VQLWGRGVWPPLPSAQSKKEQSEHIEQKKVQFFEINEFQILEPNKRQFNICASFKDRTFH